MAGPWGDISPHLHQLLKLFAESRVAAMGRAQGQEPGPGLLGKIMGEIRRGFSVAVVRSQGLCLLERLSQLGPGARAAAEMGKMWERVDGRGMRREEGLGRIEYEQAENKIFSQKGRGDRARILKYRIETVVRI